MKLLTIPHSFECGEYDARTVVLSGMPPPEMLAEANADALGYICYSDLWFSHIVGARSVTYLQEDMRARMDTTRRAVAQFLHVEPEEIGPTYSQQARALMKYLDFVWPAPHKRRGVLPNLQAVLTPWHYQRCMPGRTAYSVLCDLQQAYMQVAQKISTPLVTIYPDGFVREALAPADLQRRWADVLALLREHKGLYTRFVGCATAGIRETGLQWFRAGLPCDQPHMSVSSLAPWGALVIRATAELCQVQALAVNSRYANIDSVSMDYTEVPPDVRPADTRMPYWDSLGVRYSVKAYGPAHYLARGAYAIGEAYTWLSDRGYNDLGNVIHGTSRTGNFTDYLGEGTRSGRPWMLPYPPTADTTGFQHSHTLFHEYLFRAERGEGWEWM